MERIQSINIQLVSLCLQNLTVLKMGANDFAPEFTAYEWLLMAVMDFTCVSLSSMFSHPSSHHPYYHCMCCFLQTQGIVFSYNEYGVSHSLKENLTLLLTFCILFI